MTKQTTNLQRKALYNQSAFPGHRKEKRSSFKSLCRSCYRIENKSRNSYAYEKKAHRHPIKNASYHLFQFFIGKIGIPFEDNLLHLLFSENVTQIVFHV